MGRDVTGLGVVSLVGYAGAREGTTGIGESVERGEGRRLGKSTRTVVGSNSGLELSDVLALNVEVPLVVAAHLSLHLVDLLEREYPLHEIDHVWFEYVSSQMTLDAIKHALMNRRWPDDPQAPGKRVFSRCRRSRAAKVTINGRRVRRSA